MERLLILPCRINSQNFAGHVSTMSEAPEYSQLISNRTTASTCYRRESSASDESQYMESDSSGHTARDTVIRSSYILEQTFAIADHATLIEGAIPPHVPAFQALKCNIGSEISQVDSSPVSASSSGSSFLIRGTPSVIGGLPIPQCTPSDERLRDANDWRQRQRDKFLGALRRQIEWIVLHDGPISVCDILAIERIRDLTEQQSDIIESLSRSYRARLRRPCNLETEENALNLIIELV